MKSHLALLLSATVAAACAPMASHDTLPNDRAVTYHCSNGESVAVRFFPAQGVATLARGGRTIELQQQPAASPRQHGSPTDPTARLGAPVPYAGGAAAPEIHFGRAALLAAALLAAAFAAGSALGARRR